MCSLERSSRWLVNSIIGECEHEEEDKWQKVVGLLVDLCGVKSLLDSMNELQRRGGGQNGMLKTSIAELVQ